jgi:hypothetical protein
MGRARMREGQSRRRLPREVLELPRLGALNVHPSALPKYRGPSPVLWAIRNGNPFMGVSVHRMTERIDDPGRADDHDHVRGRAACLGRWAGRCLGSYEPGDTHGSVAVGR